MQILVVGGGIAGLSAAAHLSADGEVTLLEAESALGYHASGRSAALIEQNYGPPAVQVLNRASFPLLKQGGYLSPRGLMILGRQDENDAFRADVAQMGLQEITTSEAIDRVPILDHTKVAMAAYHSAAYDIDTDRLLQSFAKQVRAQGGKIHHGQRVCRINRQGARWKVTASSDTYEADLVVNAAGAWADDVARMAGISRLGIIPHRRSMARIAAPGGKDTRGWPMFFGVGESWYAKPDAGALLVSPADEDPTEPHDAWADDMTLARGLAQYEEMVTTPVTRMLANWAGLRSFAADRTLVLGPDPRAPGFVWCAGQGGYGIQTSFAAGRFLADVTFDRPTGFDAATEAALRPERLI